jgi:hypothetical protein
MDVAALDPSCEYSLRLIRRSVLLRDTSGFRVRVVDRWLPQIRDNFSLTWSFPPHPLRTRFETCPGCFGMRQEQRTDGEHRASTVNEKLRKVLVLQA